MNRKTLLIWIILLTFGFASMPDFGFSSENKLTGKTEIVKKKNKKSRKNRSKKNRRNKKRKGSKNKRSAGKTKYTKKSKYSKHNKFSKRSKYSKKKRHSNRKTYVKRYYTPPTNNGTVEYRNYKRNNDENTPQDIEKIAPQKEIRKEPKKEGE